MIPVLQIYHHRKNRGETLKVSPLFIMPFKVTYQFNEFIDAASPLEARELAAQRIAQEVINHFDVSLGVSHGENKAGN